MSIFVEKSKVTKEIGKINLINGQKYNPLSLSVLKSITKEITLLSEEKEVKVIIISSNGPGFSAGHDLEELKKIGIIKLFF